MNVTGQTLMVAMIVLASVVYLFRQVYRFLAGMLRPASSNACGGCHGCERPHTGSGSRAEPQIIPLHQLGRPLPLSQRSVTQPEFDAQTLQSTPAKDLPA